MTDTERISRDLQHIAEEAAAVLDNAARDTVSLRDAVLRYHTDNCLEWQARFCEHEMCRIAAGEDA